MKMMLGKQVEGRQRCPDLGMIADKVVNPAFVDFENVRDEIKLLLVQRKIEQNVKANEQSAQITFISIEETALERALLRNHMKQVDSVTDEAKCSIATSISRRLHNRPISRSTG